MSAKAGIGLVSRSTGHLDILANDLRYGFRGLRRSPQLSFAAVLVFVVGLSLSSAVFSLVNGLFFRPQVSHDPASFIQVYALATGPDRPEPRGTPYGVTLAYFNAARGARTLSGLAVSRWISLRLDGADRADLRGQLVSCNYMTAHMRPALAGRALVDDDCLFGRGPVAVLTERGWSTRFARDPDVVGKTVRLNHQDVVIVGVMKDEVMGGPMAPLIFVPYTAQPLFEQSENYFNGPNRYAWLNLTGRLVSGRSASEAEAELQAIATSLDRLDAGRSTAIRVTDGAAVGQPSAARHLPLVLALSVGSTTLVLLLVCATVGTLLLARGAARRHEMAVRVSLGASRSRLIRQMLTEGAALALPAGAVSVALAVYLPGVLAQSLTEFPVAASLGPDWRVLAHALVVTVLAGCAAALAPALEAVGFERRSSVQSTGRAQGSSTAARRCGHLLSIQLAIGFALVVAGVLMLRTHERLLNPWLGYDPEAVLVAPLELHGLGYSASATRALSERLRGRLVGMPGVRAVAFSSSAPFRGDPRVLVSVEAEEHAVSTLFRAVSADYFTITRLPPVRGRLFSQFDAHSPEALVPVIVSEALERRISPQRQGVGRRMRVGGNMAAEIVGVVANTTSVHPGERDEGILYLPTHASNMVNTAVLIQFTGAVRPLMEAVRVEARAMESRLSVAPETVAASIRRAGDRHLAVVRLSAIPAGIALFLSVVGAVGVSAFGAAQRTHEIGVRMALGARRSQIVALLSRSSARSLLIGFAGGLPLAALAGVVLRQSNLLAGESAFDAGAYAGALLVLATAVGAATLFPALKAARQDAWRALRAE